MLKVLYAGCPSLSLVISAQFALEMWQKPVWDFLLVINSNLTLSCTVIELQRLID